MKRWIQVLSLLVAVAIAHTAGAASGVSGYVPPYIFGDKTFSGDVTIQGALNVDGAQGVGDTLTLTAPGTGADTVYLKADNGNNDTTFWIDATEVSTADFGVSLFEDTNTTGDRTFSIYAGDGSTDRLLFLTSGAGGDEVRVEDATFLAEGLGTFEANVEIDGDLRIGDGVLRSLTLQNTRLASDFLPFIDDTYDLGSSSAEWSALWVDGTANIDDLAAGSASFSTAPTGTAGCATGYARVTPSMCILNGSTIAQNNLTSGACTTVSAPGDASVVIVNTRISLTTANSAGTNLSATIEAYPDSSCASGRVNYHQINAEEWSAASNQVANAGSMTMFVPVSGADQIYLKFNNISGGGATVGQYGIYGYLED